MILHRTPPPGKRRRRPSRVRATGSESASLRPGRRPGLRDDGMPRRCESAAAASATAAASAAPRRSPLKTVTPEVAVDPAGTPLGAITAVEQDGASVTLTAEHGAMRVSVPRRPAPSALEADPSGELHRPGEHPAGRPGPHRRHRRRHRQLRRPDVTVADGDPITALDGGRLARHRPRHGRSRRATRADGSVIWAESAPITFGALLRHAAPRAVDGEQFIGGGMQNGRSVHTGATVNIARNFDWDDDGYPNAVPYYMSSNGYGVLRNTFARGSYDFAAHTTTHEERRFDAYYFVGDYKAVARLVHAAHRPPDDAAGVRPRVRRRRLLQPLEPDATRAPGPRRSCARLRRSTSRRTSSSTTCRPAGCS